MENKTELQKAVFSIPELLKKLDVIVQKFTTPIVPVEAAAPAPEAAAPTTDVKTKDGKVISIVGEPKPGADCMMDGKPCMDGNYELEDGSTLVTQGGKIVDMQPKAQETQPEAQAAQPVAQAEVSAPSPTPTKITKYSETTFDAHFASFDELKAAFVSQSAVIEALVKTVEQISNTPSEKTTFKKKDGVKVAGNIDYTNETIAEYRKRNGL